MAVLVNGRLGKQVPKRGNGRTCKVGASAIEGRAAAAIGDVDDGVGIGSAFIR